MLDRLEPDGDIELELRPPRRQIRLDQTDDARLDDDGLADILVDADVTYVPCAQSTDAP